MYINLVATGPSDNNASAQVKAAWQAANISDLMLADNITVTT
jgi:hypothetical protein